MKRSSRLTCRLMMLTMVFAMVGCNVLGFFGQAFAPKEKKIFALPDRPTLVLVDDIDMRLGDPSMPNYLSRIICNNLLTERVLTTAIPSSKLDPLMLELGDKFNQRPIDWLGRQVGADQVIHVRVVSASLYPQPGLLEPQATVEVKVIDAIDGVRLFPDAGDASMGTQLQLSMRGYPVNSKLRSTGAGDEQPHKRVLIRNLADRMARDIARLFHDYMPRQPGQPFE